jgi:hypothetical protein
MHGDQPHQLHTVLHHQVHIVNTDVIADMNIHEDDVPQQAVHQQA